MTFDLQGAIKTTASVNLLFFDMKLIESAEGRVSDVDLSCCCGYSGLFCKLDYGVPFCLAPSLLLSAIFNMFIESFVIYEH